MASDVTNVKCDSILFFVMDVTIPVAARCLCGLKISGDMKPWEIP